MQKTTTINQNYLFQRLYRKGSSLVSPCMALYYRKAKGRGTNRLGITTSKKIGGAVQRNRARRVIREAYRLLEPDMPSGLDLVIVARTRAREVKMQVVKAELEGLVRKLGQGKPPGKRP